MNPGIKLSYSFERHVNYFSECSVCFVDVSIHESQLRNISPNRLFCHLVLLINSQSSDLESITVVCNVSTKDIDFLLRFLLLYILGHVSVERDQSR